MCSCSGRLERHNRSKDALNHLLNVVVSRISPQAIIKQVLEFLEIMKKMCSHKSSLRQEKLVNRM